MTNKMRLANKVLPPPQSQFWKDPAPQPDAAIVVAALAGELPRLPGLPHLPDLPDHLLVVVGEAVPAPPRPRHLQPHWSLPGALNNKHDEFGEISGMLLSTGRGNYFLIKLDFCLCF